MEDKIKNILNNKIEEPIDFEYMIRNTINAQFEKKNRKNKIIKSFTAAFACFTIIGSAVFANEATDIFKKWFGASDGVENAINNGYIEEIKKDYTESDGANVKVAQFVMDDLNLNLSFNAKLNESIDSSKLVRLKFQTIKIFDESNNIIFSQKDVDEVNEQNVIKNEQDNYDNIYATSYTSYISSISSNNMDFLVNLAADDLPNSKKITIQIENISLSSENYDKEVLIKGSWNMDINVPEKFYNRNNIKYNIISCNNENIDKNSIKAIVYNTGMKFSLEMNINNEINEKIKQYNGTGEIEDNLVIKNNAYVENEKGEKFYISAKSDGDGGYGVEENKFKYWQTFNITSYDATQKLKVVLETGEGENIIINLQK